MSSFSNLNNSNYNNNARNNHRIRAMHWDPKNPTVLLLPRVVDDDNSNRISTDSQQQKQQNNHDGTTMINMEQLWADTGIGCNAHELSALMKIITAHEHYMNMKHHQQSMIETFGSSTIEETKALHMYRKELATKYRSAVRDCLSDWEMSMEEKGNLNNHDEGDDDDIDCDDGSNLHLLQIVYSIMHVSDIFLPLLSSAYSWADYHSIDPFQKPGLVTAATVRYLRYHHMDSAEDMVSNISHPDEINEMMNSVQPEQFQAGRVYWEYLQQLVLRGSLEKAWDVLRKHSLFAIASSISSGGVGIGQYNRTTNAINQLEIEQMSEVDQGFLQLKEILLRAPLPGGRNENYDDALGTEDRFSNDIEAAFFFMEGLDVLPGDYRFWEMDQTSSTFGNDNNVLMTDFPIMFNEQSAVEKHRQWSDYVKDVRPMFSLSKRIREIDSILAILCGDFQGIQFTSWAQKICAELLYRNPDCRPIQISKRVQIVIEQFTTNDEENTAHTDTMISIMEGDASTAIELIYTLGGAAGAALPATLMSLLYNLFVESSILTEDLAFRKSEFLCEASAAIISSLAETNQDIGVQLAARLMIPYSVQSYNVETVSAIANILEHYNPTSDQYADTLITHVTPLIELKSILILDGCVKILLLLFKRHKRKCNMVRATHFLLTGIKLESKVLPADALGICFRTLAAECHNSALAVLNSLAEQSHFEPLQAVYANDIAIAFAEHSFDTSNIPEATELLCVLNICDGYGKDDNDREVGNYIVACLERRKDSNGVCRYQSPLSSHWPLLLLACRLIEGCAKLAASLNEKVIESPFDEKGITLLLECLIQLAESTWYPRSDISRMEQTLVIGLNQAVISKNNTRKQRESLINLKRLDIDSIRSVKLDMYDINVQEEVLKRMFDF